ncbi:MAG: hypothetical protein MJZ57_07250 [Bacteroidales bacterium]|nr:hypothetical protein [Bacteroidales bacterium]
MKQHRILSIAIALLFLSSTNLYAQKNIPVLYSEHDDGRTFTTLEEALAEPENVYRLKLNKLPERDSLPEELFQLTELRELTIKGCRLCIVNQRIGELTHLQYLNLDRNKLVRLPESIGNLTNLHVLIISRNLLETLPDAIAKLKTLTTIDAWDNPLYVLPQSITALQNTLKTLDLRQIPLSRNEYVAMTELLPHTDILFTDICECENHRDHD